MHGRALEVLGGEGRGDGEERVLGEGRGRALEVGMEHGGCWEKGGCRIRISRKGY